MEYRVSEKFFDRELKNKNTINEPLKLTLDSNIQYIVDQQLNEFIQTFNLKLRVEGLYSWMSITVI